MGSVGREWRRAPLQKSVLHRAHSHVSFRGNPVPLHIASGKILDYSNFAAWFWHRMPFCIRAFFTEGSRDFCARTQRRIVSKVCLISDYLTYILNRHYKLIRKFKILTRILLSSYFRDWLSTNQGPVFLGPVGSWSKIAWKKN